MYTQRSKNHTKDKKCLHAFVLYAFLSRPSDDCDEIWYKNAVEWLINKYFQLNSKIKTILEYFKKTNPIIWPQYAIDRNYR